MVAFDYCREPFSDSFNREIGGDYEYYLKYARRYLSRDSYKGDCSDLLQESIFHFWRYVSKNGMPDTRDDFRKLLKNKIKQKVIDFARYSSTRNKLFVSLDSFLDERYVEESVSDKRNSYLNPSEVCESREIYELLKNRIAEMLDRRDSEMGFIFFSKIGGVGYNEIAKRCSIPYFRARNRFEHIKNKIINSKLVNSLKY